MKWVYCDNKGNISKVNVGYQIDTVGNICQQRGGVIPKACQKCKRKFNSKPKEYPIEQNIPFYVCKDCEFKSSSSVNAFDHTLDFKIHKIQKSFDKKIVDVRIILSGRSAIIKKLKNDVKILCVDCT